MIQCDQLLSECQSSSHRQQGTSAKAPEPLSINISFLKRKLKGFAPISFPIWTHDLLDSGHRLQTLIQNCGLGDNSCVLSHASCDRELGWVAFILLVSVGKKTVSWTNLQTTAGRCGKWFFMQAARQPTTLCVDSRCHHCHIVDLLGEVVKDQTWIQRELSDAGGGQLRRTDPRLRVIVEAQSTQDAGH